MVETELEIHEAANIFPLHEDGIPSMAEDIKTNGQQKPIELYEGKILDGRRRHLACQMAGIEPIFCEVFPEDPVAYSMSLNLERRHLNKTQAAVCADRARDIYDRQARDRQKAGGQVKEALPEPLSGQARDAVAKKFKVTGRHVDKVKRVREQGVPELYAAVEGDKMSLNRAEKLVTLPPDEQRKAISSPSKRKGNKSHCDKSDSDDKDEKTAKQSMVLSKGDEEAKKIVSDFYEKLDKVTDGGLYAMESMTRVLDCSVNTAFAFIRMCEISPAVQVHRNYGRKGLTQYSFERTKCATATERIIQLAEHIATDSGSSARTQADARRILNLLGR